MVRPSRALVRRKLKQAFPDRQLARTALGLLDQYGVEAYELERERVQLAILKLSEGALDRLQQYVQAAKTDYRDVVGWAEYPEQMRASSNAPPQALRAIRKRDRQQYARWLSE